MSTIPRVPSALPGEEPSFRTALAHCPDLARAFFRLYGTVWTEGQLPQDLKETARMRNARLTGCGYCRNVRFDGARAAGLTEEMVACIEDGYESSELPDVNKLVLAYTDAYLRHPGEIDPAVRDEMAARFSPEETMELTLALSLFLGMAKTLISLGMEPAEMDITVVPTPALAGRR
jgi:AhpD family alkylhydroperoxidase